MSRPTVYLICCQHGNEIFGKQVYDYFLTAKNSHINIKSIIANPLALKKGQRFIDTDLNRSFKKSKLEGYEADLTEPILKKVANADYVIDIHTTTAPIDCCVIVTKINKDIKMMLSHIPYDQVVFISSKVASGSLIGNVRAGISLEFNEDFAKSSSALSLIDKLIKGLSKNSKGPFKQKTKYTVSGKIENDVLLKRVNNFEFNASLGGYPILYGEKNYKKYQGFYAKSKTRFSI